MSHYEIDRRKATVPVAEERRVPSITPTLKKVEEAQKEDQSWRGFGSTYSGPERRKGPEPRIKKGLSPTGKERRVRERRSFI